MVLFTWFPVVICLTDFPSRVHGITLLERNVPESFRRAKLLFNSVKELFKFQNFKLYQAAVAAIKSLDPPSVPPKGGDPENTGMGVIIISNSPFFFPYSLPMGEGWGGVTFLLSFGESRLLSVGMSYWSPGVSSVGRRMKPPRKD